MDLQTLQQRFAEYFARFTEDKRYRSDIVFLPPDELEMGLTKTEFPASFGVIASYVELKMNWRKDRDCEMDIFSPCLNRSEDTPTVSSLLRSLSAETMRGIRKDLSRLPHIRFVEDRLFRADYEWITVAFDDIDNFDRHPIEETLELVSQRLLGLNTLMSEVLSHKEQYEQLYEAAINDADRQIIRLIRSNAKRTPVSETENVCE